jgi:hypothetical protein
MTQPTKGSEMSDQLGTLEKVREELRKQFFSYAQRARQPGKVVLK